MLYTVRIKIVLFLLLNSVVFSQDTQLSFGLKETYFNYSYGLRINYNTEIELGFLFRDKLMVLLQAGYANDIITSSRINNDFTNMSLRGEYIFLDKKVSPFLSAKIGKGIGYEYSGSNVDEHGNITFETDPNLYHGLFEKIPYFFNFSGGVCFRPIETVAINLMAGYQWLEIKIDPSESNFGYLSFRQKGMCLSLGVNYLLSFNKKDKQE